jgi:hypothetical protein
MLLPPEQRSDELGGARGGELSFLNVGRYFAAHDLPVPRVYHAAPAELLLLLEDIGDTTLWKAVSAEPARTDALFTTAVDLLVRLQVAGIRHPDPGCVAFGLRFDGNWRAARSSTTSTTVSRLGSGFDSIRRNARTCSPAWIRSARRSRAERPSSRIATTWRGTFTSTANGWS